MKVETEICDICKDRVAIIECHLCGNKICCGTGCGISVSIMNSTSSSYLFYFTIEGLPYTREIDKINALTKERIILCKNCKDKLEGLFDDLRYFMPSKFQKGDVVRVYTKALNEVESQFGKKKTVLMPYSQTFPFNPNVEMFTFPHYRVMIIEDKSSIKEAHIKFPKNINDEKSKTTKWKNKRYYIIADERCVRFLNPYGDAVMTKASKEERERFMEKYVANKVAKDL